MLLDLTPPILFGSKFYPLDSGPDTLVTREAALLASACLQATLPFRQGPRASTLSPQCLLCPLWPSRTHTEPWAPSKGWRNWSLCLHLAFLPCEHTPCCFVSAFSLSPEDRGDSVGLWGIL